MPIKNFKNCFKKRGDILYFYLSIKDSRIPKKIKIDKFFMRQFGKWFGDKTNKGGDVGLTGLNEKTFKEWTKFLNEYLKQPLKILKGEISYGKNKEGESRELLQILFRLGIRQDRIYLYKIKRNDLKNAIGMSIYVQNSQLRKGVFDFLNQNKILEYIFGCNRESFFSFIGGLFDSDGNVNLRDNHLRISFSVRATKRDTFHSFYEKFKQLKIKKDWFSKLFAQHKFSITISPKNVPIKRLKKIYNRKSFINLDIRIGSRKSNREKDFLLFWELIGKKHIKEKFNDVKKLILYKDRTKNAYVLYVFYLLLSKRQLTAKEIATSFRKEASTIQRALLSLTQQHILERKRTVNGYKYSLGKKAKGFINDNIPVLIKIIKHLNKNKTSSYKTMFFYKYEGKVVPVIRAIMNSKEFATVAQSGTAQSLIRKY